jgi:acyl transferase domain-containing protein
MALAVKRFKEERPDSGLLNSDPIAIVGIGCRFPGNVHTPDDCWRVLSSGIDTVTEIPGDRWPASEYYDPDSMAPGKTNSRWGGFISDPSFFDPVLFGISPREAASIDPQQRLLLEVAWEAIQDSGSATESLAGTRTGVFVGIGLSDYERLAFEDASSITSNSCTGTYRSVASGRISYLLDLRGPSVSIDTACSSSLVAVHEACQSLRVGESDLALAGGVSLHLLPEHYVGLARLGMLAADGRCKPFDANANGFVPSEGSGLVVLKRLSDALAAGDRIYAVIRGSAVNQDGRSNSLTAPSGLAQQDVVLAALRNGHVPPSSISYVETHGTGTALGDPIEVEALAAVLGGPEAGAPPCVLGAAKSNFGHLEAAAGVVGLIKAALAFHNEEIPANLHFERLNPHISLEGTRFCIPTRPTPWPRGQSPRFAGVSSFGFGGTNAHVVLEESPRIPVRRTYHAEGNVYVLLVSARTAPALNEAARACRNFLAGPGQAIPLYDICHASALRRTHYEERLAVTAGTHAEMCGLLDDFLEGRWSSSIARGRASSEAKSTLQPSLRKDQAERTVPLSTLGMLHVAGHPVSWQAVYREPAPPVSLPSYPYQRQRFLIERRPTTTRNRLHPLVGRRLLSPSIRGTVFEAAIGTAALPYLAGHVIQGAMLLPITAFLEMVQHAASEASGAARALIDITVLEPLALAEDVPARVQIVIEDDRFQVYSLVGERWNLHASGRIAALRQRDSGREPAVPPPFAAPESFYAALREQGALFGAPFQTIRALARKQSEAWAHAELGEPEKREAASYRMHPALLDGCLQTAVAAAPDGSGLFLPFAIDRFECFAPAGSEAHAHARLMPSAAADVLSADIDIRDHKGIVVARLDGVHLKRSTPTEEAKTVTYEPQWRLTERGKAAQPPRDVWLLGGEDSTAVGKLASALNACGLDAKVADAKQIDATRAAAVVWLVGQQPGKVLSLAQDLLRRCFPVPPQLWLVTQGAVSTGAADTCDGLFQSPVWGMARTIAVEHPELRCVRVDLDPAAPDFDTLAKEIANSDGEDEIAFRPAGRYVLRLAAKHAAGRIPRRWTIPARGSLENLALAGMERRPPARGEVEVEIETSALNFRDVLNVLGMYPGDAGQPGAEFCGTIARVGEGVSQFRPGDRVMGIGWGSFATFVTTPAALVVPVPEGWGAVDAATVPNAFLTAYHCLVHLGRLNRGERVLIHAAAGGVGLAAVQLAILIGAEIYATAGSAQKREYLRSLGVAHIFDSRTLDFREQIAQATAGKGVDLILNSLAGDFIEAGFSVLSVGGRFVEIGKNRIWSRERVASLGRAIQYFVVDLAEQIDSDQPLIQAHLSHIRALLESGALRPLPARVFRFEDAPAAFRYMAHAKHTGKIVLRHPTSAHIRADATYLITGGLGAIGLRSAQWLVERGARNLVLVGRRNPDERALETIDALRQRGARIEIRSADVALRDEIAAVLREIDREMPPLAGILHAAGVLDDGVFLQQTWPRIEKVLAPKADGAWNLHEITAGKPLDFFVLFSSVASLTGSPGQAGYAASNAFLDALAHYRHARGLTALSVNWGAWAESGMAARVEESGRRRVLPGIRPMQAERCFAALESMMAEDTPQVVIADAGWTRWNPAPRLLSALVQRAPAARATGDDSGLLGRLEAASVGNRRRILVEYLRGQVIALLEFDGSGPYIDERQPLLRLGMDSLMAVEFRNILAATLERPLSATLLFDHPTIGALADFLNGGPAPENGLSRRDALLEELETLSDAEAEELLSGELDRI